MKILSISHTDLDGFGSQFVINEILQENNIIDNINLDYSEVNDYLINLDFNLYDKIYITDLNISNGLVEYINSKTNNVILIDHHLCDEKNLQNSWYILDTTVSACLGVFNYFNISNSNLETFAKFVSAYDTWQQSNNNFQKAVVLSDLVFSCSLYYDKRSFIFQFFKYFMDNSLSEKTVYELELEILKFVHNLSDENAPSKQKLIMSEYNLFCKDIKFYNNIGITSIPSSNFQYLSSKYVNENFNIVLINYNEQKGTGSVRSRNGKAIEVAKALGGGGHADASGFLNKDGLDSIIQILESQFNEK